MRISQYDYPYPLEDQASNKTPSVETLMGCQKGLVVATCNISIKTLLGSYFTINRAVIVLGKV